MANVEVSPQLKPEHKHKEPPVGLGGWFTFIIIGLIVLIISGVVGLSQMLSYLVYYPVYFIIFLSICIINELFLSAVLLFFIYKRNIIFRKLYVIQTCILIASLLFIFILSFLFSISTDFSILGILARILWTVYLFRSERVHNTFIGFKTISHELADNVDNTDL